MNTILKLRLILQRIEDLREALAEWEEYDSMVFKELTEIERRYYRQLEKYEKQLQEEKP